MENYNDEARELLAKRLDDCSSEVDRVNGDTEDYRDLTDRFVNIYRLQIDEKRAEMDAELKNKQLEADIANTNKSLELKQKELELREAELKVTKRKFIGDMVEKGVTLATWFGLSCLVMTFEQSGGAIMSKAFSGILPRTKI